MKPEHQQQDRATAAALCPPNPWAESSQTMPSQQTAAFDSEEQRPTHDALSDIYNRGYE